MSRFGKEKNVASSGAINSSPNDQQDKIAMRSYKIALRAYQLFEEGGCTHGNDKDHWLQAEREILNRGHFEVTPLL